MTKNLSCINIEIKFDSNTGQVIFRNRSPQPDINEHEEHPKCEIILNLHLYKCSQVKLHSNGRSILNDAQFSKEIQQRLEEFFLSFKASAASLLDESTKPIVCDPAKISIRQLQDLSKGFSPKFYLCSQDPKKKQGYRLSLAPSVAKWNLTTDEIYIRRAGDHRLQ